MNIVFHAIDVHKRDCLYVMPNQEAASDFSASRFDPALESSPHLETIFSNVDNVGHKRAGIANLYVRGSGSRTAMKSVPANVLVLDERDEMNTAQVSLAERRVSGSKNFLIVKLSTPSIPMFGIDADYQESTQGVYMVKCPGCGRWDDFTLENIQWDMARPETGKIICKSCKREFSDEERAAAIVKGEWDHLYPNRSGFGWQVPQMLSPVQNALRICTEWLKAMADKAAEQEFYNSTLGLAHLIEGSRLTKTEVQACFGQHVTVRSMTGVHTTMGVDVGAKLHFEIAAWEATKKRVLCADTVDNFEDLDVLMRNFRIKQVVIDMMPEVRKSREFCKRHPGKAFMCYYGKFREIIGVDEEKQQIVANRTETMDITLDRYRSSGGLVTLPHDTTLEQIEHLCAQVRMYEKVQGINVAVYRETGPDHYAHAANYNEIAGMVWHRYSGGWVNADLQKALDSIAKPRMTSPDAQSW